MSNVITGIERCGCVHAVFVLGEHDADAYREASRWAKAGCEVVTEPLEAWKQRNDGHVYCAEHRESGGPPWWKRNRTKKREATSGSLGL